MSGGLGCQNCRVWEERYNTLLTLTKAQKKNLILLELDRKLQIATVRQESLTRQNFELRKAIERMMQETLRRMGIRKEGA